MEAQFVKRACSVCNRPIYVLKDRHDLRCYDCRVREITAHDVDLPWGREDLDLEDVNDGR